MKLKAKVERQIESLSTRSKASLQQYRARIGGDYDLALFDDKVKEICRKYEKVKGFTESTVNSLDAMSSTKPNYPRGFTRSSKRYDDLAASLTAFSQPDHHSCAGGRSFRTAKELMMKRFSSENLRMLEYDNVNDIHRILPKDYTHAGFSFIQTGNKTKGSYMTEEWFQKFIDLREQAKEEGTFAIPILIGTRTQGSPNFLTSEYKGKTRMVNMVDINVIAAEMQFAIPFQNDWFKFYNRYAGGKDDTQNHDFINHNRVTKKHYISIDYSKFDESQSSWLIEAAFDLVRNCFRRDIYFDERLWKVIVNDFIHKVFITKDGLVESHRGVPSGSMFTQIIDSIVNELIVTTYLVSKGIQDYDMRIMGDDNIIFTNQEIDLKDLATYITNNFGIEVNPSKCHQGSTKDDDIPFLSRLWKRYGVTREPKEIISRMLYPERFRNYRLKGKEVFTPEDIFAAYYMCYPLGMREAFDMSQFFEDIYSHRSYDFSKVVDFLPGSVRYAHQYLGITFGRYGMG